MVPSIYCLGHLFSIVDNFHYGFFPDKPVECRWLSDSEEYITIQRIRANNTGTEDRGFKGYQLRITSWIQGHYHWRSLCAHKTFPIDVCRPFLQSPFLG